MTTATFLGLDLGTSSLKGVVTDDHGRVLARSRATYALASGEPGHAECEPRHWWDAVRRTVAELRAALPDGSLAAIGLCGQMHGLVLADDRFVACRPAMLWADTRAIPQLARYRRLATPYLDRLANPLSPGMAGPLWCWVAEHEPNTMRSARWALQPKDWLRAQLTGRADTEPSDASATLLYDVIGDRWDVDLAVELGLDPGLLAPVRPSGSLIGELTPRASADLGIPAGVPIAAGAADTAAAALGTGLVGAGLVQLTLGTGGQLVTPREVAAGRAETGTHLYRAATKRGWYAMGATLNAGLALEWVRSMLAASWDELYSAADGITADDPLFLPHLAGERTPYLDPGLRGGWSGLALDHDRHTLLRSALEGVAHAVRDAFDALPDADQVDSIRLAGGGSHHPAWRQLLADVLGRPLLAVETPDASARGAALLAAVAVGATTEADIAGPLAPSVHLAAHPRRETADLHRSRLGRFRGAVQRQRSGDRGGTTDWG